MRGGPVRTAAGYAFLLLPCAAVLDLSLFDRLTPAVLGIPFVDAYLLFWVAALTPCLILADRLLRDEARP